MNILPPLSHYVESEEVISKPGAKITVKILHLTEAGRKAITTGEHNEDEKIDTEGKL